MSDNVCAKCVRRFPNTNDPLSSADRSRVGRLLVYFKDCGYLNRYKMISILSRNMKITCKSLGKQQNRTKYNAHIFFFKCRFQKTCDHKKSHNIHTNKQLGHLSSFIWNLSLCPPSQNILFVPKGVKMPVNDLLQCSQDEMLCLYPSEWAILWAFRCSALLNVLSQL